MDISTILSIVQLVLALLLVVAVLLQQRGTGLSATFGGEGNVYRTKRGLEKIIFFATIVLAAIFFVAAVVNILISS